MEDAGNIRELVCQRIGEVENAMKSLQTLRKTILHKSYEAKQTILNTFISERDLLQSKEMGLLMEVDKLLHSKDDALVTQLSKLSQVLGCLRNCLESPHPCHDCLEKFDDIDMLSVSEVSLEFSRANDMLKDTLRSYREFNQASSPSPMMMDTEDNITKWLLTPTNNHLSEREIQHGRQELISTEWLVQYHSSTESGVDAGNHFTRVKAEGRDEWLDEGRSIPNSLYMYVLQHFYSITTQNHHDWLQQESYGRSRSVSDSDCTTSISGTSSFSGGSSVLVPSSTSSEASSQSFVLLEDVWSKRADPRSSSPYEVSEWVSTCRSEADDDNWLSTPKEAAALSDFAESVCGVFTDGETEASATSDDWLHKPASRSSVLADDVSGAWLTTKDDLPFSSLDNADALEINCEWLAVTQPPHRGTDLWLALSTAKMEILQSEWQEEKHDVSLEKACDDDWLAKYSAETYRPRPDQWLQFEVEKKNMNEPSEVLCFKMASLSANDWLTSDEKADLPEQSMRKTRNVDKEWLLVKNHMSKISASADSDWLLENRAAGYAKPSPRNNRKCEAQMWLC